MGDYFVDYGGYGGGEIVHHRETTLLAGVEQVLTFELDGALAESISFVMAVQGPPFVINAVKALWSINEGRDQITKLSPSMLFDDGISGVLSVLTSVGVSGARFSAVIPGKDIKKLTLTLISSPANATVYIDMSEQRPSMDPLI